MGYPTAWYVGSRALVEDTPENRQLYTSVDKFKEEYKLYTIGKGGLLVPRRFCVIDETTITRKKNSPLRYFTAFQSKFNPRDEEQQRLVDTAVAGFKQDNGFCLVAPPSAGKTIIGGEIACRLGYKTLIVCTKTDICNQWRERLSSVLGIPPKRIGLIQGTTYDVDGKWVVVAMFQSLMNPEKYPREIVNEFELVIFDECHRAGAARFSRVAGLFHAHYRLGLSATPKRKDGRDDLVTGHIGKVRVRSKVAPMVPKVTQINTRWRVPMWGDEPMPIDPRKTGALIKYIANDAKRNYTLARYIIQAVKKKRRLVAFAANVDHLTNIAALIDQYNEERDQNITYGFYISEARLRKLQKAGLAYDGSLDEQVKCDFVFATYGMMSEGSDFPELDTCLLCSPRSDVEQITGRLNRPYEGKPQPIIGDVVDWHCWLFAGYFKKRKKFYNKIGAIIYHVINP